MKNITVIRILSLFILCFTCITAATYSPNKDDYKIIDAFTLKIEKAIQKKWENIRETLVKKLEKITKKQKSEKIRFLLDFISLKFSNENYKNTTYVVTRVIDGDTISIENNNEEKSVRLIWVDTPEKYATRFGYKECFWDEASAFLKDYLEGKEVYAKYDPTQTSIDKYDRHLLYIFAWDVNVNKLLIEKGYGFEYTYKTAYEFQEEFKNAEKEAQENQEGLWSEGTCNGERIEIEEEDISVEQEEENFNCDKPKYCKNMNSCEEAYYYLNTCGAKSFDRDEDTIPCENICPSN